MSYKNIEASELSLKPFNKFNQEWALISSGNLETGFNTMVISWGGMGTLWNKNVATIYIREQRYTYEFLNKNDYFTISFLPSKYKAALNICGSKSGRDIDKVKEANLSVMEINDSISFEEADLIFVCKKVFISDMSEDQFLDHSIVDKHYPQKDFHRMFIGEIVNILEKE